MTNKEASCVLKLKMEIHKQMFGKEVDEPLKTAYEMAIIALEREVENGKNDQRRARTVDR